MSRRVKKWEKSDTAADFDARMRKAAMEKLSKKPKGEEEEKTKHGAKRKGKLDSENEGLSKSRKRNRSESDDEGDGRDKDAKDSEGEEEEEDAPKRLGIKALKFKKKAGSKTQRRDEARAAQLKAEEDFMSPLEAMRLKYQTKKRSGTSLRQREKLQKLREWRSKGKGDYDKAFVCEKQEKGEMDRKESVDDYTVFDPQIHTGVDPLKQKVAEMKRKDAKYGPSR
eukprot:Rmarinus@m.28107